MAAFPVPWAWPARAVPATIITASIRCRMRRSYTRSAA